MQAGDVLQVARGPRSGAQWRKHVEQGVGIQGNAASEYAVRVDFCIYFQERAVL